MLDIEVMSGTYEFRHGEKKLYIGKSDSNIRGRVLAHIGRRGNKKLYAYIRRNPGVKVWYTDDICTESLLLEMKKKKKGEYPFNTKTEPKALQNCKGQAVAILDPLVFTCHRIPARSFDFSC